MPRKHYDAGATVNVPDRHHRGPRPTKRAWFASWFPIRCDTLMPSSDPPFREVDMYFLAFCRSHPVHSSLSLPARKRPLWVQFSSHLCSFWIIGAIVRRTHTRRLENEATPLIQRYEATSWFTRCASPQRSSAADRGSLWRGLWRGLRRGRRRSLGRTDWGRDPTVSEAFRGVPK